MYKVNVMNPCSCFVKNGFVNEQEFKEKEEAKTEAQFLMETMQTKFCKKHDFSMIEQFGNYTIYIKPRS